MLRVTRDQLIGLDRLYLPTAARARRGKHFVVETVTCTVSPFLTGSIAVDGVDAGYTLPVTILQREQPAAAKPRTAGRQPGSLNAR
jgi:hypothetical protein